MRPGSISILIAVVLQFVVSREAAAQYPFDQQPINYSKAEPNDAIARLRKRLESGEVSLMRDGARGYLTSLLKALDIPVSSQTLVFSKTSFQRDAIEPATPRALYFDDETYVGYVQGGDLLEIATSDPKLGAVFYTLDQTGDADPARSKPQAGKADAVADKKPFIRKTYDCLQCHAGPLTHDLPGLMMRSVFVDPRGQPILSAGTKLTTHESPMDERFGGWYVTGRHGPFDTQHHRGNLIGKDRDDPDPADLQAGANITDLSPFLNLSAYPSRHSDLVALMVLAHQIEAHNLMTEAAYACQYALRDSRAMNKALGQPLDELSDSTVRRIHNPVDRLLKYLLFCDEAKLAAPIEGTSRFRSDFEARGPRDSGGRSLRDFDLQTRLFKYPLSYLVYSPSIQRLPDVSRRYFFRRLFDILTGSVKDEPFDRINETDRFAILDILRQTMPTLPEYWRESH